MSEDVVRALEGIYESVERAFQRGDIDAMDELLTPDFVAYDQDGSVKTRAEVMRGFREMMSSLSDIDWKRRVTEVRFEGEDVVAKAAGVFRGRKNDGSTVELDIVAEDTWVRTSAGFQNRSAKSIHREDRSHSL
jgi:ketosteroid isomerase-like protein